MSKKSAKIAALLDGVAAEGLDPHFAGYFACFNAGQYYEAHDVLEELWLPIRREPDGDFYKGLIQLAGAFVHLQKGRLRPADALFALAEANLRRLPGEHLAFDGAGALRLIAEWRQALAGFAENPLENRPAPRLAPATLSEITCHPSP
jgi:predicted metal-dependent hydrolase